MKIVGRIPGTLEEVRYRRAGRYRGPYKHAYHTTAHMLALGDGSVLHRSASGRSLWSRDAGGELWLDNPSGVTPTAHERAEFRRAATAMYARGANARGHLLSVVAALKVVPLAQYDRAASAYREWLVFDTPRGDKTMTRRHNPYLALYNRGGGHHMKHHRRRHNPDVITGVARGNVMPFLMEGGSALAGMYGVVTVSNFVSTFLPVQFTGADMTGRLIRFGLRTGVAYAGDVGLRGMVRGANLSAFRIGLVIGVVGSTLLDLLGSSFVLGRGDVAQMPGMILSNVGLAGTGMYLRERGPAPRRALAGGASGLDAYLRTRGMGGASRTTDAGFGTNRR